MHLDYAPAAAAKPQDVTPTFCSFFHTLFLSSIQPFQSVHYYYWLRRFIPRHYHNYRVLELLVSFSFFFSPRPFLVSPVASTWTGISPRFGSHLWQSLRSWSFSPDCMRLFSSCFKWQSDGNPRFFWYVSNTFTSFTLSGHALLCGLLVVTSFLMTTRVPHWNHAPLSATGTASKHVAED